MGGSEVGLSEQASILAGRAAWRKLAGDTEVIPFVVSLDDTHVHTGPKRKRGRPLRPSLALRACVNSANGITTGDTHDDSRLFRIG